MYVEQNEQGGRSHKEQVKDGGGRLVLISSGPAQSLMAFEANRGLSQPL